MTEDDHNQCCEAPNIAHIHDYVGMVVECQNCGKEFFTLAEDCE